MIETNIDALLATLPHPGLQAIELKLDRVTRLLDTLGSPQHHLPPVVHVAGTNGKGSTIAFLRAILEAAHYKVHVYTSPHLVRFNERIILAGKEIDDHTLTNLIERVRTATDIVPATYFEATTAMAFLAFAEHPADIVLLETGMGGRLDATNTVNKPLLTVITPISMDHADYLGNTLTKIATEKAGIMKPGVPCITAPQPDDVMAVLKERAKEIECKLHTCSPLRGEQLNQDQRPKMKRGGAFSETQTHPHDSASPLRGSQSSAPPSRGSRANPELCTPNSKLSLKGHHQHTNAAVALACLPYLKGFTITNEHIRQGLTSAQWPARLQHLHQGPLIDLLPHTTQLWLDGGHNAAAAHTLADEIITWKQPTHLICAMKNDKDIRTFLTPFAGKITHLYAVPIPNDTAHHAPHTIANTAQQLGIPSTAHNTIESATKQIVHDASHLKAEQYSVIIAGSLYLAGEILKTHG